MYSDDGIAIYKGDSTQYIIEKILSKMAGNDNFESPLRFKTTSITATSVTLTWELGSETTGVKLYRGTDVTSLSLISSLSDATEIVLDDTVVANTYYYYQVRTTTTESVIIGVQTLNS